MPTKSKKAVKAPAKKSALKTDKVVRVTKNDVTRPKAGGTTARVWEICDEITERTGKPAVRKEVLAQAAKEKLKPGMAKSQYFSWRCFNGLKGRLPVAKPTMPKVVPVKAVHSRKKAELKSPGKLPKPPAKKPAAPAIPSNVEKLPMPVPTVGQS